MIDRPIALITAYCQGLRTVGGITIALLMPSTAANGKLHRENERLSMANERLTDENNRLRVENRDYKLLRKVFGSKQMEKLIEQARQSKQRDKRLRNHER